MSNFIIDWVKGKNIVLAIKNVKYLYFMYDWPVFKYFIIYGTIKSVSLYTVLSLVP